ncbi:MAG: hypothetical protein ABIZ04_05040 [Opitutus sp.]
MNDVFGWLDRSLWFYWGTALLAFCALLVWAASATSMRHQNNSGGPRDGFSSSLLFALILLVWRWPFLVSATEFDPDESQIIAGSITLTHDPVFWRSVDGTTSGPLNFYALLPIQWLGAPINYFTTRLVGLFLVWVALVACYQTLKSAYGVLVGRVAVLPAVVFFSMIKEWGFVHYTSEHVSIALFSVAVALLTIDFMRGSSGGWRTCAGVFLAGMLPWAKLQAGPLAATTVLWALWLCHRSSSDQPHQKIHRIIRTHLSAVLPSVLIMGAIVATGQTEPFYKNYIIHNVFYAGHGTSLLEALKGLYAQSERTRLLSAFLLSQVFIITWGAGILIWQRKRLDPVWIGAALFTLVAITSVLLPQRPFLHYTLFLILPLTLWGGAAVARLIPDAPMNRSAWTRWLAIVLVGAIFPGVVRAKRTPPAVLGRLTYDWNYPRSPLGNVIHRAALPGDKLTVWGYNLRLHVDSGLPQAARVGYTYWAINKSPLLEYHRQVLLDDLTGNRPTFFVDAVGPGSKEFQDRSTQGYEIFPALRDYIDRNYALIGDYGTARLFVRRDQLGRPELSPAELERSLAAGRSYVEPY